MKGIGITTLIFFQFSVFTQEIMTIQPGVEGKDAFLRSASEDSNFGNHPDILARGGFNTDVRGIFQFDLSSIPKDMEVEKALLTLYSYDSPSNGHHQTDIGSNESWIEKVIEPWSEEDVTWSNQPATTSENRVYISNNVNEIQNYIDIDLTIPIKQSIQFPDNDFGFLLRQIDESPSSKLVFASSDNEDVSLHPKLVLYLRKINGESVCVRLKNDPESIKDAYLRSLDADVNRGNHPEIIARAATNAGSSNVVRSIFDFDFSIIPENATILSANLTLYSLNSQSNGAHVFYDGGINEAEILRVIEPWEELNVTFNNQPATTETNKSNLEASIEPIQNYYVNMTEMMIDYWEDSNNSYGFLIKQKEEIPYSSLVFSSSDNDNEVIRPNMEVCYSLNTRTEENELDYFSMFPNPSSGDILTITSSNDGKFTIQDNSGKVLVSGNLFGSINTIDISSLVPGVYNVIFYKSDTRRLYTKQLIKN